MADFSQTRIGGGGGVLMASFRMLVCGFKFPIIDVQSLLHFGRRLSGVIVVEGKKQSNVTSCVAFGIKMNTRGMGNRGRVGFIVILQVLNIYIFNPDHRTRNRFCSRTLNAVQDAYRSPLALPPPPFKR